jgi:valyl-tRNA synthetase
MEMMQERGERDRVPFRQVHIHGLVRDAERQKMSKTKGNVIDPLLVNDRYGTDAVRFGLLVAAAPGNDIALSEEIIERGRNFANKIWNASRLLFTKPQSEPRRESLADRWIGARLNAAIEKANRAFELHRYHEAADAVWTFFWDEFCDWYLELKKSETDWGFAYEVHERALLLLHPLMPFITEELWHRRGHQGSIAVERYPQPDAVWNDPEAEREMRLLQDIVTEIRGIRADNKIDRRETLPATLQIQVHEDVYTHDAFLIERLANVTLKVEPYDGAGYSLSLGIPVPTDRLSKENEHLEKVILSTSTQLENQDFISKAPAKVVDAMQAKLAEYQTRLAKNKAALGE